MRRIGGTMVAAALLATSAAAQEPALTLTATSVGCHWRYAYAGPGGVTTVFDAGATRCTNSAYCPLGLDPDRAAAVPVGVPVRLVATSADTLRVLAVPPLGLQVDALPGRTSEATLEIEAEGLYPGRRSFDAWLKQQRRAGR